MLKIHAVPAVALACVLSSLPTIGVSAQTPDRAELMKSPKYATKDIKPTLKTITADELKAAVKVTSGRSSALFGFNAASIEVHLPRIDNSVYAVDTWETPKLFDAKGHELAFEKEQGIYDHRTYSTEIRISNANGKPKQFAKAVGSMTLVYPLAMSTVSLKKGETTKGADHGVVIDGPFVRAYAAFAAEAAFGNDIETVRAYDKSGKRLERVMGYSSSGFDEVGNYRQWAYEGEVARADVDVISQRLGLKIAYEMPPAPVLPDSMAGRSATATATIEETPGGKFTLTTFRVVPPAALGSFADYSIEDAKRALHDANIPEANNDALMRAATEGDTDAIRFCLIAGVDPDGSSGGMTPLLLAASFGHTEAAKVLILAGANVNARNEVGATPLLQAAGRCDATGLVEMLIKAKADVNAKAKGGATPLAMATAVRCTENAAALKKAGGK